MSANKITLLVFFLIISWNLSLIIVPFIIPARSVEDLTGASWAIDNLDKILSLRPHARITYLIGDITCHQIAERSYYLNNNQMAICSRCFGLYLGIMIGMMLAISRKIELTWQFVVLVVSSVVPLGIDGTGQLLGYWVSTNTLRVLTGLLAGIGVGTAFVVSVIGMQEIIKIIRKDL